MLLRLLAVVTLLGVSIAGAEIRDTLRGLTAFSVDVVLEKPCNAFLDMNRIRTDLELKLRSNGLRVKDVGAFVEEDGAELRALVSCMELKLVNGLRTGWGAYLSLQITQMAVISRLKMRIPAKTWEKSDIGVGGRAEDLEQSIRSHLRDFVDDFLNDYFIVNPRQRPLKPEVSP